MATESALVPIKRAMRAGVRAAITASKYIRANSGGETHFAIKQIIASPSLIFYFFFAAFLKAERETNERRFLRRNTNELQ